MANLLASLFFSKASLLYNKWVWWVFFFKSPIFQPTTSRDSHGQQNTNFIRKVAESKNWMPGAKMEATLGERTQSPPTQELKQLTGWQGCGGQGCQHFQGLKTLNKQKINIHGFYKLQHYETVGHITQKKNLQYLQSLILRSLEKQWFFLHSFMRTKFYKER